MAYVPKGQMTPEQREAQRAAMAASAAAARARLQGTPAPAAPQQQQQQATPPPPPPPYQSPPLDAFLLEPYVRKRESNGLTWNPILTAYATIADQTHFDRLQSYKALHQTRRPSKTNANNVKLNWDKKQISLNNRFAALLEREYVSRYGIITLRKAGCVIVFADGKALYTVNDADVHGFPKGDIEFTLADPKRLSSVGRETPEQAALRELMEETGFYPSSAPVSVSASLQPFPGTLHRKVGSTVDPVSYTLEAVRSHQSREHSYLILFVKESSTAPRPDLTTLTENAKKEKIVRYAIEDQYASGSPLSYNSYSQIAFTKTQPGGGKTRKHRRRTRRGRKTRGRR